MIASTNDNSISGIDLIVFSIPPNKSALSERIVQCWGVKMLVNFTYVHGTVLLMANYSKKPAKNL